MKDSLRYIENYLSTMINFYKGVESPYNKGKVEAYSDVMNIIRTMEEK